MKLPVVTKTQYPRLNSVCMFDPREVEPLFRLIRICASEVDDVEKRSVSNSTEISFNTADQTGSIR